MVLRKGIYLISHPRYIDHDNGKRKEKTGKGKYRKIQEKENTGKGKEVQREEKTAKDRNRKGKNRKNQNREYVLYCIVNLGNLDQYRQTR